MNLYDEFFAIIEAFEKCSISYAVIGGVALAFHQSPRLTRDIDILVEETDLESANKTLKDLNFIKSTDPHPFLSANLVMHRFLRTEQNDYLLVDILVGKGERFQNILDNVIESGWEKGKANIARKKDLIWLKELRGSEQDKIDIINLSSDEEE